MAIDFTATRAVRDIRNGDWFWISKYVWHDDDLTSSDKVVYGSLAYFANQEQTSFPSINKLGIFSSLSNRQVYRSIKKLELKKYISIKKGGGRGFMSTYYLLKIKGDNLSPNGKRVTDNQETVTGSQKNGDSPRTTNNIVLTKHFNNKDFKNLEKVENIKQQIRASLKSL